MSASASYPQRKALRGELRRHGERVVGCRGRHRWLCAEPNYVPLINCVPGRCPARRCRSSTLDKAACCRAAARRRSSQPCCPRTSVFLRCPARYRPGRVATGLKKVLPPGVAVCWAEPAGRNPLGAGDRMRVCRYYGRCRCHRGRAQDFTNRGVNPPGPEPQCMGNFPRKSGNPKVDCRRRHRWCRAARTARYVEIAISWPLHIAQPVGAKLKPKQRISATKRI